MLAEASLNGALGQAGLLLGARRRRRSGRCRRVLRRPPRDDRRSLRMAPRYAWLCVAGAVLAFVMMQRALITRDFSLAYVQQVGSRDDAAALQLRRHVVGARGRRSCCGC